MKGRSVRLGIGSLLVVSLFGCDDDSMSISSGKSEAMFGSARKIAASGEVFRLGSSSDQAAREESPSWTRFSHDYWLDTTETTQGEFESLMGRNPSPPSAMAASNPVVSATWFDAILFCNARSKRDGLDTVYEYRSLSRDAAGSVWEIQGLASRLERSGWRLPTEAEWEFAARAGTSTAYPWGELADSAKAVEYAWYQKNAAASLHEVARLKPNAWGIYDMAGNAMEWVQDWKGSYPQDTVVDFTGLDAPSDIPEAPLKGGSYTYGLEHLRPSSRSATYAAYRSAKAEYVGFRCARGGFSPTYTNTSGQSVQAPPVSILRPDLAKLLGAQSAHLVFLNRSNGKGVLSWIDFGEAVPVVRSLLDKDPVFHPSISPDGQWVAWCTVMEGSTGVSRIKARRLSKNDTSVFDLGEGAIPRWWANGLDTFLVRAKALDNTSGEWSATSTTAQRWSNGTLTGSVQAWSGSGSYHDGRSGRYLYTGYRRLRQHDVVGGKNRTLFSYPQNGKRAGDTSQVCNVSAAPDGSGRVLFLDFGYSGASTVVGRPYGIHEVAFVADSLGDIVKTLVAPEGKSQWDHLEWSNRPRWAVGMALESNSAYKEAHLLDLNSGTATPLVSGHEIWMPMLWVGSTAPEPVAGAANPDSTGRYFDPVETPEGTIFGERLLQFWLRKDSADVVVLGSSHSSGLLPSHFPSHRMLNLSVPASTIPDWDKIARRIVLPNAPRLKVMTINLMAGWFFPSGGAWPGGCWSSSLASTTGMRYDSAHDYWKSGFLPGFVDQVKLRLGARSAPIVPTGIDYIGAGWGGVVDLHPASREDSTLPEFTANMASVEALAATLARLGIHLVMINAPQSPAYRKTVYAGRYGPTWPAYHAILERFRDLESRNPYFHLYDAYLDGMHDYVEEEAGNWDHLAIRGSQKLGRRLDSLFTAILAK